MPDKQLRAATSGKKRRLSAAAVALRFVAGALTIAAVVGGAGWLMQQNVKRKRPSQDPGKPAEN